MRHTRSRIPTFPYVWEAWHRVSTTGRFSLWNAPVLSSQKQIFSIYSQKQILTFYQVEPAHFCLFCFDFNNKSLIKTVNYSLPHKTHMRTQRSVNTACTHQIQTCTSFASWWILTVPPPLPCTSNPGQFLSPVWGTSDVGGCGFGRTGGQDVSLIITQSDLLPAPDSLPPAPDTSSMDGGLEGMEIPEGGGTYGSRLTASSSSKGTFRILPQTDTMPWSANWLILRPLFSSARLPLLPLRSPLLP